jgi:beta-glucanase (GH16 family)
MKLWFLFSLLFFLFVVIDGWVLVWSDEFDGTELNTTNWNIKNNQSHCCGPQGQPELELYLSQQVFVSDGKLRLQTQRKTAVGPSHNGGVTTYNYVSGWVDTYGHFSQV